MGSQLSPVVASLSMEYLEERVLNTTILQPKMWIRYVDDTFIIWPHGSTELEEFHQHLLTEKTPLSNSQFKK